MIHNTTSAYQWFYIKNWFHKYFIRKQMACRTQNRRLDIFWLQQLLNALHRPLECREHAYMLGYRTFTNMSELMSASIKKSNCCHKIIKWFEKIENTMALDNNVASEIMQYHKKKNCLGNLTFPQIIFLKDRQMGEHWWAWYNQNLTRIRNRQIFNKWNKWFKNYLYIPDIEIIVQILVVQ